MPGHEAALTNYVLFVSETRPPTCTSQLLRVACTTHAQLTTLGCDEQAHLGTHTARKTQSKHSRYIQKGPSLFVHLCAHVCTKPCVCKTVYDTRVRVDGYACPRIDTCTFVPRCFFERGLVPPGSLARWILLWKGLNQGPMGVGTKAGSATKAKGSHSLPPTQGAGRQGASRHYACADMVHRFPPPMRPPPGIRKSVEDHPTLVL